VKALMLTRRAGGFTSDANTRHCCVGIGHPNMLLTEASQQRTFRTAGTLSQLYARILNNDHTSIVATSRINTANGTLTFTVGASATGEFTDTTHSDAVAAGDLVGLRFVSTGGTLVTFGLVSTQFETASPTQFSTYCLNSTNLTVNFSDNTLFTNIIGRSALGLTTTESDHHWKVLAGGSLKALFVVGTNNGANPLTFKTRINGADGTNIVTLGSGASGQFEDTTHTDTIAAGDTINLSVTAGLAMVSSNFPLLSAELVTDAAYTIGALNGNVFLSAATTYYNGLAGELESTTTEADVRQEVPVSHTFSKMTSHVISNGVTATSTIRFRKNGANGNQSISIGSGATGFFEDASNSDAVVATDEVNYQTVVGASGTTLQSAMLSVRATTPTVSVTHPPPMGWMGGHPTILRRGMR